MKILAVCAVIMLVLLIPHFLLPVETKKEEITISSLDNYINPNSIGVLMKDKSKFKFVLLPCPFCGKSEAFVDEDYVNSFITVCGYCTATSRRMYSPEAAANQWNKRKEQSK